MILSQDSRFQSKFLSSTFIDFTAFKSEYTLPEILGMNVPLNYFVQINELLMIHRFTAL